jgi:predicted patatin/cPLA2 family phospholipase
VTETIEIIKRRKTVASVPMQRGDGFHVALVIEGGGMRGVASGGMVSGLERLGLLNCFDSVHGSSAGAAAGAYFVAGQAQFGTRMFYEDLCGEEFINKGRILHGGPVMDTSFLVDHVMTEVKPIDFATLSDSKVPLHIVTTDIDSGLPVTKSRFNDYESYREFLKASVSIPFIAGRPQVIEGKRLTDGGLLQQIALQSAFASGASHVLVLQTRRRDEQKRPANNWKVLLQAQFLQSIYGGRIGAIYRDRSRSINESVDWIWGGVGPGGECICEVSLDDSINYIHRLTKDPEPLRRAAEVMSDKMVSLFGSA